MTDVFDDSIDYREDKTEIDSFNNFEVLDYFVENLVAAATGGVFPDVLYKYTRGKVLALKAIDNTIPKWVKTCRSSDHFWEFIKAKYGTYKERRAFLRSEFEEALIILEDGGSSPIDHEIAFDENHINNTWQKALKRKYEDHEGAITMSRTLLEDTLNFIADERQIELRDNLDLHELYKKVSKELNMAPEQHHEKIFKQILGGANGIVNGLGSLRNKLGDAHGKKKAQIRPSERHSELAVNLAGSMAIFLYKTHKQKEI